MRCKRCKGKLVCVACAGRVGGRAKVPKGFAVTGGARESALRRWALQRAADLRRPATVGGLPGRMRRVEG